MSLSGKRRHDRSARRFKLRCFQGQGDIWGSTGTCTLIANGAHINTVDGDDNPYNNYAGVYIASNLGDKLLSDVNKLAFDYSGIGAAGGSPRLSIPIDINGDGLIDDINTDGYVVLNDATCTIWYNNISYPNWAAFTAANLTYRIASDEITFIIVDAPGTFDITNVQLGKGPAKSKG